MSVETHLESSDIQLVWVSTDEYSTMVYQPIIRFDLLIIDPNDSARKSRWENIFLWYQLRLANCVLKSHTKQKSWVAAVGNNATPSATYYARHTGQRHISVVTIPELLSHIQSMDIHDIVIVALISHLDPNVVEWLNAVPSLRWRLLVAADCAGLSFVVVKHLFVLAAGGTPRSSKAVIVDAISQTISSVEADGKTTECQVLTDEETHRVVNGDWGILVLRAHGEGTHINLNTIVLCGRVGPAELDQTGWPITGGCSAPERLPIHCKRSHGNWVTPQLLSDLRAERVALYSCNGFQPGGAGYPSNSTVAAALMDGYALEVLCNDRPGAANTLVLEAAALRSLADGDMQALCAEENDRHDRLEGARPWALLGGTSSKPFEPAAARIVRLHLPTPTDFRIRTWAIELGERSKGLLIGKSMAIVVLHHNAPGVCRLLDRTTVLEEMTLRIHSLRSGARLWVELQDGILRALGFDSNSTNPVNKQIEAVAATAALLRDTCTGTLTVVERCRRDGVDLRERAVAEDLTYVIASQLRLQLADLLVLGTTQGSADKLFELSGTADVPKKAGLCNRCDRPTTQQRFVDRDGVIPTRLRIDCPTCGPLGGWFEGGPRLYISTPEVIHAGNSADIHVRLTSGHEKSCTTEGILLLALRDKSSGLILHRLRCLMKTGTHATHTLPFTEASPDLHTIRAIWVSVIRISYCRTRISVVNSDS